jgi:hypothetical protein
VEPKDSEELVAEFCPEPVQSNPHSHNLVFLCSVDRASQYNLVNKNQLGAQFVLSIFINPYMFRATMGPSSGENTVSMRHLELFISVEIVKYTKK